jgi:O-antigen ligase
VIAPAQIERPALASLRTPQAWIAGVWAAVVLVTLFRDGGSSTLGVTLGTCLPLLVVAAGALLVATGRLAPPAATRAGWIAVLGLAGLAAAAFASISWSVLPQSSWDDALRAVSAGAALVCGLWLAGVLRQPLATACILLTGVAIPAVLWALTARSFHALVVPAGNSRLQEPLPYPNALGILCATCALAALWTATRRHPALRLLGGASLGICLFALPLTTSRGSILALAAGLAVVLALEPRRLETLAALGAAALVAIPLSVREGTSNSFSGLPPGSQTPYAAGVEFLVTGLVALVSAAALSAVAVMLVERLAPGTYILGVRVIRWCGIAVAALGVLAYTVSHGGPIQAVSDVWHGITGSGGVGNGLQHNFSLNSNERGRWWSEAWHAFTLEPWRGFGAGTFRIIDTLQRPDYVVTGEEHNAGLHVLSGLGLLGTVPALAALIGGFWAAIEGFRRQVEERTAAVFLLAVLVAFALHAQLDWDWSFTALSLLLYATLGVLASAGLPQRRPDAVARLRWGLVIPALAAALVVAIMPFLAQQAMARADTLISQDRPDAALVELDLARGLAPVSIQPLQDQAGILLSQGRKAEAERVINEMIRLQPLDWSVWNFAAGVELGLGATAQACRTQAYAYALSGHFVGAQPDPQICGSA